jgi:photosystem II stability/assembly factor-like uncharacterized protein
MKRFKLLFCLLFTISLISTDVLFTQDWYQQQSGTSSAIRGVYFNDPNTGTVVSSNGSIIRTTDGGTYWTMQVSGTSKSLYDICITDANTGIAVGNNGTILRTTNAGMTWTQQYSGTTKQFNKIFFSDPLHGIIVGNNGTVYRTSNGGLNWLGRQLGSNHLKGLHFVDQMVGMVVGSGGTIYRTTDGGGTWIQQSCESPKAQIQNSLMCTSPDLEDVFFTNINFGTIVGSGGRICRTVNGGTNWAQQSSGTSAGLHGVFFVDGNTGTAVGDSGIIVRTTDGGLTWRRQISGTKNTLFDVFFSSAAVGTTVGANGTILRTVPGVIPCPEISLKPSVLNNGSVYVQYQSNLTASGGTTPYVFSVSGGALPSGTTLSSDGLISGIPVVSGTFTFSIAAKDTKGCLGFQNYSLVITAPQFSVSTNNILFGDVRVDSDKQASLIVTNTGNSLLVVSSLFSDNSQFSLDGTTFGLMPGENKNILVSFAPTATGFLSGTITMVHNAMMSPSTIHVSGTGVASLFSLSEANIDFGDVRVGSYKSDSLTVTNTGNTVLTISSVSSDRSAFVESSTSFTVDPSVSKKFVISFLPASIGMISGNIVFTHDGANSPTSVSVNGTGITPDFSINQSAKSFGDVLVGSNKVDSVEVKNSGSAPLTIFSVTSDMNEFSVIPTNVVLSVGTTQRFLISFHPQTNGALSGTIIFNHDAQDSTNSITVDGIGVSPVFSIMPTDIAFGEVLVGSEKKDSAIVTNSGTTPLTINSVVSSTGEFTVIPQNVVLTSGSRQVFSVNFKPSVAGVHNAQLVFSNDASGSPATANLTGNGVVPGFVVTPSIVKFGNVLVGTSSQQVLNVRNTGSYDLSISSAMCDNAQFVIGPLYAILKLGAEQIFTVTFRPTTVGMQNGTITFAHNASQSPTTVSFNGNGVVPGFSAVPAILSYGSISIESSKTDSIVVTNSGLSPLTISSVASDNSNFIVSSGSVYLQTGGSHIFQVTFTPNTSGLQSGNIIFNHDGPGSPGQVGVTGTGMAPIFWVDQSHISFGDVELGSSKEERVYIRNIGSSALTIYSIEVNNNAFSTSDISGSILPGTDEELSIFFSPKKSGATNGIIIVNHNGSNLLDTIIVSGVGVHGEFSVFPTNVSFGNVPVGSYKKDSVLVANLGTSLLTISSVISSDQQFSVSPIKASIIPGGHEVFFISFCPIQSGTITSAINFDHNGLTTSSSIAVQGLGVSSGFLIAQNISFGNVVQGTSKVDSIIVKNTGNNILNINSVVCNNTEFSIMPTSGTVAPSDAIKFYITYSASQLGGADGLITFNHDAEGSPATLLVKGTCVASGFTVTPENFSFGKIPIETEKLDSIIVTNTGSSLLTISAARSNKTEYTIFPSKAWIPPLCYQIFHIAYRPFMAGKQEGALIFVHNAASKPDTVSVTGTGTVSLTLLHLRDSDGNPNTTYDLVPKSWLLSLYSESVKEENLITQANEYRLQSTLSRSGVYIACIADSGSIWNRINGNRTWFDTLEIGTTASVIDSFIQIRPNNIIVNQFEDLDGNVATSDDRIEKTWHLEIHRGSVDGPVIASGDGATLEANYLCDGTYYVMHADSSAWISLGYALNGVIVPGEISVVAVTLTGGESASLDFINAPPIYSRTYRSFVPEAIAQERAVLKRIFAMKFCAKFVNTTGKTINGLEFTAKWQVQRMFVMPMTSYSHFTSAMYDGRGKWVFQDGSVKAGDTVTISGTAYLTKPLIIGKWGWLVDGVSQGTNVGFTPTGQIPLLPMPNYANLRNELLRTRLFGLKGLIVGVPQTVKGYGWVQMRTSASVRYSLKNRFGIHNQAGRGFDKLNSGRLFVGVKYSLSPSIQNNELFANIVALRFGITASAGGRTPIGFGELIYDEGAGNTENPFNGMMVKEISRAADSLIMGYYEDKVHKFVSPSLYGILNETIRRINETFSGQIDTVSFGTQLVFKGTKRIADVSVLHPNPGVEPARIYASQEAMLSEDEEENQEDQYMEEELPTEYRLEQNYPNPFNPVTTIQYALPEVSQVTLIIYNILGQEVVRILDGVVMTAGRHELEFDGTNFSSGVYVYRVVAHQITESSTAALAGDINKVKNVTQQEFTSIRKMMLVK